MPGHARAASAALAIAVISTALTGTAGLPHPVRAATPAASPAVISMDLAIGTALGDLVTFYGRGYGHGVGMSQYGARGRAVAGQDASTILAHYYQGTTISPIDPATPVRVLVLSRWVASDVHRLAIVGQITPWTVDGLSTTFPAGARLEIWQPATDPVGTWHLAVSGTDGGIIYDGSAPSDIVVRSASDDGRLQLSSKATRFNLYRGSLHLVGLTGSRLSVVNDVALDQYLGGVVPVEMPSTWPAAALEAQAIAARSFVARRLHPTTSFYDVPDDSTSQIYRGVLAERSTTAAAIASTAGQVLISGSSIANALFHSTGGGATESNENVYTTATGRRTARPVNYLRGSSDRTPDGVSYDAAAPYATWSSQTYGRSQLSAWFASDGRTNVGDLIALDLHDRGVSGRLVSVTLIGSAGNKRVSGTLFQAIFNKFRPIGDPSLRSTLFDLAPIP